MREQESAAAVGGTHHRYLMCQPSFFDVSYVINPWMRGHVNATSPHRAEAQWRRIHAILARVANVELVGSRPGLPDMPFTANAGLVLEDTVVLTRFRHRERQPEEAHFERWFCDKGFAVLKLPLSIPFEGAGDALLDRRRSVLWMGHGHRSSLESLPYLQRWLDIEVLPLRLVDERFYHLDTCFCPLEDGYLMYFPQAFDEASLRVIADHVPASHRIPVADDDALHFACNAVNVGGMVILNKASKRLAATLAGVGFQVVENELTEFIKAGGSAKCLTLRLNETRPS
jgi:N-dimethylarginine dimethylaminohydrolase